ncbi:phospholipase A [Sulfurospirillum barnesii]|uniref:Phosphatidylcholine 1-acylhydrolase n=1 Tax=Sulfurospirillum barnesii (strain ATCC 700032 / DSM 10660 / SES-3) TaxID=760154 RepID=I3Y0S0_SULBS|nr:phospholipase A [Sulfurospirillum barnesii]AFL69794.1 outer membrane phospholipase A [Sulfurospirillum barnesii SES-3]
MNIKVFKKQRFFLFLCHFPLALMALDTSALEKKASYGDASAAYALAQQYEAQNDKESAFIWYKKAATLSLEEKTAHTKALEDSIVERLQKIERTEAVYSSFLDNYDDADTYQSMKQMITQSFDIAPYKMNYLLPATYDKVTHDNRKHQESKFQLSFQKDLVDNLFGLHESIVLAYTQTSWWQTSEDSAPFRETNYQPELFVIMPHFDTESFIKAYQFGILHESNGKDSEKSRSWNRLYAKGFFQAGNLIVSPRIWYRIKEDEHSDDNPNIEDYLGYGDLELIYPWKKHTFKLLLRNNLHFDTENKGAVQLDWTFPLWEENLFGYIQLYSGYAESLIDYNKRTERIGIGFALSR